MFSLIFTHVYKMIVNSMCVLHVHVY